MRPFDAELPQERTAGAGVVGDRVVASRDRVTAVSRAQRADHPEPVERRAVEERLEPPAVLRRRLEIQHRHVESYLAAALRADLGVDEAARRYSALLCPELYHLLTTECGWAPDQYRGWVVDLLQSDLLGHQQRVQRDTQ